MWTIIYKIYATIYSKIHNSTGINIRGLGWIADKLKKDKIINFKNVKLFFNSKIPRAYPLIYANIPAEPDTHEFFERLYDNIDFKIFFINIGASVGDFAITLASNAKTEKVYAYEPNTELVKSLIISMYINNLNNLEIIPKAVSDESKKMNYYFNKIAPLSSSTIKFSDDKEIECRELETTFIDMDFEDARNKDSIMLIDVEGAELNVIRGAKNFIFNNKPLIIFEYNSETKKIFSLEDILAIIGSEYCLYNIVKPGKLTEITGNTWNIVAVNKESKFYKPIMNNLYINK
jgi:FkbM family methyltransferase